MQVKISFDPAIDNLDSVLMAVVGAFGADGMPSLANTVGQLPVSTGDRTHDPVAAAQNFAAGVESNGQHFQPSPEAAAAALALAAQQAAQNQPGATQPPASAAPGASEEKVVLDKNGIPWDARIHADGAERMTKTGVWKKKRGVHDSVVKQVEGELRTKIAANPGMVQPTGAQIPPGGVLGGIQTDNQQGAGGPNAAAAAAAAQQGAQQPGPTTPPGASAPPAADPTSSFAALMRYAMSFVNNPSNPSGPLFPRHLEGVARGVGLFEEGTGMPKLALLEDHPELFDLAKQWVDHYVANPQLLPEPSANAAGLPGVGA